MKLCEIGIATARTLLDFSGGRDMKSDICEKQLEGAVAIHNILVRHKVAYLADEVGMGKTYVALGAVSLFRHFHPDWRVLYIAPRQNIQEKWVKELRNFTANNWKIIDNRVRSFQDAPAYGFSVCGNLVEFAHQLMANPNRDFFLRMSSFSIGLSDERSYWRKRRDELMRLIPWMNPELLDTKGDKGAFKDNYARVLNLLLPQFDLIVVDEAHNLKHGLSSHVAARNRAIAQVLGHQIGVNERLFPAYGRRLARLLLLSATPLEVDFREFWNQLDIFDFGKQWKQVGDPQASQESKEEATRQILIRRLTDLRVGGKQLTKNLYRREWRNGGVKSHDQPLPLADQRQRLVVGLIQKKVAEILGTGRFNNSFQIGMLSSFESFLETAKSAAGGNQEDTTFGDSGQTDSQAEKEGIDSLAVNVVAETYRKLFHESLPHPKMDALVETLSSSFVTGEKALVFVRRIRSVDELTDKLNEAYDKRIHSYIRDNFPISCRSDFDAIFERYLAQRRRDMDLPDVELPTGLDPGLENRISAVDRGDQGDNNSFFAWFFRGEGPPGVFSGAAFNKNRLSSESSVFSLFFEEDHLIDILGNSEDRLRKLADLSGIEAEECRTELRLRAHSIFRRSSTQGKYPRLRVYLAYQESALALIAEKATNSISRSTAEVILRERFGRRCIENIGVARSFPAADDLLKTPTFFTEIRKRPHLCAALWPVEERSTFADTYRRREQRRELLAAAARLGHPLVDLWLLAVKLQGTLDLGSQRGSEENSSDLISAFLDLLEVQQNSSMGEFNAFAELSSIARHFDLICDVNFPVLREQPLQNLSRLFGTAMGRQNPVAGMSGEVNKTLVRQFLMPGYPLVLTTTDILREGADLHTFCSRVYHYGISWTPSSMEQRTGRIDRINSLVHRRLDGSSDPSGEDLMQVYYPHLKDTIERLQVERVYQRMNKFLRLMHRSLGGGRLPGSSINAEQAILEPSVDIEPVKELLETAFGIRPEWLLPELPLLPTVDYQKVEETLAHFNDMIAALCITTEIHPEPRTQPWTFYGTVQVVQGERLLKQGETSGFNRVQPIALFLRSAGMGGRVLLRCVSPVGRIPTKENYEIRTINEVHRGIGFGKICCIEDTRLKSYDLTVESDILFHYRTTQQEEVLQQVTKTAVSADLLEQSLVKGADRTMTEFRNDLVEEPDRG